MGGVAFEEAKVLAWTFLPRRDGAREGANAVLIAEVNMIDLASRMQFSLSLPLEQSEIGKREKMTNFECFLSPTKYGTNQCMKEKM